MKKETITLWHPECPGTKVTIQRNWFQKLIYPKEFATLSEVICLYKKR